MRTILFKAKRKDNKEWIAGDLIQTEIGTKYILPIEEADLSEILEVIPETVCQYIGIKDKLGSMIFDNSIMRGKFGSGIGGITTKFKEFNFLISFQPNPNGFQSVINMPKDYGRYRFCPYITDCIIVGNLFDNKELLQ